MTSTQPLRRSKRIAAKARAEANTGTPNETQSKNTIAKVKPSLTLTRARARRMSSRSKSCCSLQSLEQTPPRQVARRTKAQKKTSNNAPAKAGVKRNVSTSPATGISNKMPASTAKTSRIQRVSSSPSGAVKSNSKSIVTQVTPGATTKTKLSKGVQFNLERNSIAQYNKDNPPNLVEHLTYEVTGEELFPMDDDNDEDDVTTRQNEALLEEWEANFEDLERHVTRPARISSLP